MEITFLKIVDIFIGYQQCGEYYHSDLQMYFAYDQELVKWKSYPQFYPQSYPQFKTRSLL